MKFFKKYSGYIGFGSLLSGMIIGGWGWDKFESTITARTHGSVFMIIVGVALIIIGLLALNLSSQKR